jgi:large subunit ribosomal protein L20
MPRVKRGVTARPSQKVLNLAKGFRGRRGNVFRVAKQAVMKAGQYAYRDRRTRSACSVSCGSLVSTLLHVNWV